MKKKNLDLNIYTDDKAKNAINLHNLKETISFVFKHMFKIANL